MSLKEYWKQNWHWPLVGFAAGIAGAVLHSICSNEIPNISKVKEGSIPPNKLEILVEDVDFDGKKEETILRCDGKAYLLKYVENKEIEYINNESKEKITRIPAIVPFEITEKRR